MHFARALAVLAAFTFNAAALQAATTVATVPEGYVTLTVAAGTGAGLIPSVLSFPLQSTANASGQMAGVITGVTSNTITNANAGWSAGQLSQAATPYLLQFTSGQASGRTFLLSTSTANTATTVTLDPNDALATDLTTLGITTTDTYQIIPADTLLSVLGTPATTGVAGGTSGSANCDLVDALSSGGWIAYYYNTSTNHWTRASFPYSVSDNVVIRPDTGVIYNRYVTSSLSFVLVGRVPSVARQAAVHNSGITALSNSWPVNLTLATSSIQTLPGWVDGSSSATADTVQAFNAATGWRSYYYNGTDWHVATGLNSISNNVSIPVGSLVIINKHGTATGQSILLQPMPYTLESF